MIIIYSGGLDSTVLLNEYKEQIKLAVSFNYGSKHNKKEISFAKINCRKLGIKHIVIDLPFINQYFKSDLLKNGGEIPKGHYADDNMKSTAVPFRNGIMLSIAAGVAESVGTKKILIANHKGDHTIYPDCRQTFINEMNSAIAYGTYSNVNIFAPYTNITKRDIALKGKELNIDFSNTWSCYKGLYLHCGECGTCIERKEALLGFDETEYIK
jgi:7-cyano-7-deazaguanine synthase